MQGALGAWVMLMLCSSLSSYWVCTYAVNRSICFIANNRSMKIRCWTYSTYLWESENHIFNVNSCVKRDASQDRTCISPWGLPRMLFLKSLPGRWEACAVLEHLVEVATYISSWHNVSSDKWYRKLNRMHHFIFVYNHYVTWWKIKLNQRFRTLVFNSSVMAYHFQFNAYIILLVHLLLS